MVTLFVEGGDKGKDGKDCKEGFRKLLDRAGLSVRVVPCGSRGETFERFETAVSERARSKRYPIMLVDSEDPVAVPTAWDHLFNRDGWVRPDSAAVEQAQLMATCMETWIVADASSLRLLYPALQQSALPPMHDLESRDREDVQDRLEQATRHAGRRRMYAKGRRSFQLLAALDPEVLRQNLTYFKKFVDAVKRHA